MSVLALQELPEESQVDATVGIFGMGSCISHYGTCSSACQCPPAK